MLSNRDPKNMEDIKQFCKDRKVTAADVLKNWFKNLFGEDKKPLQEWKNDELNRLLLEKFNLGVKK